MRPGIPRYGIATWVATIALCGGLASVADIVRMTMPDAKKLEGAISGRALYDGRIDPQEALAILRGVSKLPRGMLD